MFCRCMLQDFFHCAGDFRKHWLCLYLHWSQIGCSCHLKTPVEWFRPEVQVSAWYHMVSFLLTSYMCRTSFFSFVSEATSPASLQLLYLRSKARLERVSRQAAKVRISFLARLRLCKPSACVEKKDARSMEAWTTSARVYRAQISEFQELLR